MPTHYPASQYPSWFNLPRATYSPQNDLYGAGGLGGDRMGSQSLIDMLMKFQQMKNFSQFAQMPGGAGSFRPIVGQQAQPGYRAPHLRGNNQMNLDPNQMISAGPYIRPDGGGGGYGPGGNQSYLDWARLQPGMLQNVPGMGFTGTPIGAGPNWKNLMQALTRGNRQGPDQALERARQAHRTMNPGASSRYGTVTY